VRKRLAAGIGAVALLLTVLPVPGPIAHQVGSAQAATERSTLEAGGSVRVAAEGDSRAVELNRAEGTASVPPESAGAPEPLVELSSTTGVVTVTDVWVGDPPVGGSPSPPRDPPVFSQGETIWYYSKFHYQDNSGPDTWELATLTWVVSGPCGNIENRIVREHELPLIDPSKSAKYSLSNRAPNFVGCYRS
jgi:hypothetical protein